MSERVACSACGVPIQAATFARHGGHCMPCAAGTRASSAATAQVLALERAARHSPEERYWTELVRRATHGTEHLSPDERLYYAVRTMEYDVDSGGFAFYFSTEAAGFYDDAVEGLRAVGAATALRLLVRARELLFAARDFPADPHARHLHVQSIMSPRLSSELDALDDEFYGDADGLAARLSRFAKERAIVDAG